MAQRYATAADLQTEYPALYAAATADQISSAVAWAQCQTDLNCWGDKASFWHRDLAAHFLAMHPEISAPGSSPQVQSRTFGEMSTTYAIAPVLSDDWLNLTAYGQRARALRDTRFVAPIAAPAPVGECPW